MKPEIIDHIAIQVKDIKKSFDWYTKNFKCKKLYLDKTWALLEFNNVKLALVLPNEHPPHISFIDKNARENSDSVMHRDGSVSYYIEDLDGNKIEMIDY
tara:strand:+ start:75 stop:371 length:297 start_codon:yes stop_codon:yes gene_type:complete